MPFLSDPFLSIYPFPLRESISRKRVRSVTPNLRLNSLTLIEPFSASSFRISFCLSVRGAVLFTGSFRPLACAFKGAAYGKVRLTNEGLMEIVGLGRPSFTQFSIMSSMPRPHACRLLGLEISKPSKIRNLDFAFPRLLVSPLQPII